MEKRYDRLVRLFAPYDKPRYTVAVMVHGAKARGGRPPIAARILERTILLERENSSRSSPGSSRQRKPNPFHFMNRSISRIRRGVAG